MPLYLKYFIAWFPMLLLAIGNGAIRDLVYKKYTGELAAHQLSTISLIIIFGVYIWLCISYLPVSSGKEAILVGLFWVSLTLLFEFGFGRFRGNSWVKLLEDYNVLKGRIWILIPVWVALAPYLFYRLHKT